MRLDEPGGRHHLCRGRQATAGGRGWTELAREAPVGVLLSWSLPRLRFGLEFVLVTGFRFAPTPATRSFWGVGNRQRQVVFAGDGFVASVAAFDVGGGDAGHAGVTHVPDEAVEAFVFAEGWWGARGRRRTF